MSGHYRNHLLDVIGMLASGREQLDYEKRVPIAYVPDELSCQFFDDHYHPRSPDFIKEFSEDEIKELGIFSGYLHIASREVAAHGSPKVPDVLKLPRWREMMQYAAKTVDLLKHRANKSVEATADPPSS